MKYIPNSPDVEGSKARSGTRTPMQWNDSKNAGFSSAEKNKIYIPQDTDPNRPTVAAQDKDPNSQLNYVRSLLKLRALSLALGNDGEWKLISDTSHPYPLIYMRNNDHEKYIIAINPSDKKITGDLNGMHAKKASYIFGTTKKATYKVGNSADEIIMPPVSAVIYKID